MPSSSKAENLPTKESISFSNRDQSTLLRTGSTSVPTEKEIQGTILPIAKESSLPTVQTLIHKVHEELRIPQDFVLKQVIELHNQRKLKVTQPTRPVPVELRAYACSSHAMWFWIVLTIRLGTIITVFLVAENAYSLVYIQYVVGSIFVLSLAYGYSLLKTLFPTEEIDNI